MNIVKSLLSEFGPQIVKGLAGNLGLGDGLIEKALSAALPMLLKGMGDKVSQGNGAQEIFDVITKDHSGGLLDNLGQAFSGDYANGILKEGGALLPMLLGNKSSAIIDVAGRVLGLGSKSKALLSFAGPLLLNFIGRKAKNDNLGVSALKDLVLGQKDYITDAIPGELADQFGFANFAASSESSIKAASTTSTSVKEEKSGGGLPGWLWPLLLLGALGFGAMYFMKGCNNDAATTKPTSSQQKVETNAKKNANAKLQNQNQVNSQKITLGSGEKKTISSKTNINQNSVKTVNTNANKKSTGRTGLNQKNETQTSTQGSTRVINSNKPSTATNSKTGINSRPGANVTYSGYAKQFNDAASKKGSVIDFGSVSDADGKVLTPAAKATFDKVAAIMQANPDMNIEIRGHNKDFGGAVKNGTARTASKVRAELVQIYLKGKGIAGKRMKTKSLGHDAPIAGKTATDDANKRISIAIN